MNNNFQESVNQIQFNYQEYKAEPWIQNQNVGQSSTNFYLNNTMLNTYYANYQTNKIANDFLFENNSNKLSNSFVNQQNQFHQHFDLLNNSLNQTELPFDTNFSNYQSSGNNENKKFNDWSKIKNDPKIENEHMQIIQEEKLNYINDSKKMDNFDETLQPLKTKRKIKKSRVLFSQWQINELEKLFKKQKYVTSNEREIISKKLKLNPNQVKIWFQNRRYKIKKRIESENHNQQNNNRK